MVRLLSARAAMRETRLDADLRAIEEAITFARCAGFAAWRPERREQPDAQLVSTEWAREDRCGPS